MAEITCGINRLNVTQGPCTVGDVRVGVYIDGFNLYFGGRSVCGRSTPGWRWLDLRSLTTSLIQRRHNWVGGYAHRIVYCTALIDGATNRSGRLDQDNYLRALQTGVVDHVELGYYVSRVKKAPLATEGPGGRPQLATSAWPVMVQDRAGGAVPDAHFMVSYAYREEKGSDVNVAAHLLTDVLTGAVDAAIVISNDSDLALPIVAARNHVPVGIVNPSRNTTAGALRGKPVDGVGRHWWYQLTDQDYRSNQLSDPFNGIVRPVGW